MLQPVMARLQKGDLPAAELIMLTQAAFDASELAFGALGKGQALNGEGVEISHYGVPARPQ